MHHPHFYFVGSDIERYLIIFLIVVLFVWLFNSYKMGKFRKKK